MTSSSRGKVTAIRRTKGSENSSDTLEQPTGGSEASPNSITDPQMSTNTAMMKKETCSSRAGNYEWKPEAAANQIPLRASDSWLIYQAQSILGRNTTLQEAKELFMKIDITTRQPIQTPKSRRSAGFTAALRALFGMGILVVAVGCSNTKTSSKDAQGYGPISKSMAIFTKPISLNKVYFYKVVDDADENVCYIAWSPDNVDVECMVQFEKDPNFGKEKPQ